MDIKRILIGVGGLTAIVLACHSQAAQRGPSPLASNQKSFVSNQIIVRYKDKQGDSAAPNTLMPLREKKARMLSLLNEVSQRTGTSLSVKRQLLNGATLVKLDQPKTKAELAALINALESDSQVAYAEMDIRHYSNMVPDDARYNEQWNYFEDQVGINMPDAWDMATGEGVVVAVIDTGYLPHADLVDNVISGYDMLSDEDESRDGDGIDDDPTDPGTWVEADACYDGQPASDSSWHGTHVAGTIAAVTNNSLGVAGVAYNAKILPIRVTGPCGAYTSDLIDAIVWAVGGSLPEGYPENPNPAKVLNMSLGGARDYCGYSMQDAIDMVIESGATIVASAGNNATDAQGFEPGNCRGVITVAATDHFGERAYYSNYGDVVDIAAPGGASATDATVDEDVDLILSTSNAGLKEATEDDYAYQLGTSMAAPHVAGVAALLYSLKSDLTPQEVKNILTSSAQGFVKSCEQCGAGFLDAQAALTTLNNGDYDDQADPLPSEALENGVALTDIALEQGEERYYTIEVPASATSLTVTTQGGTGDVDLYVRLDVQPTLRSFDCQSAVSGNEEACTISSPSAGSYQIMVYGYNESSGVSVKATYSD